MKNGNIFQALAINDSDDEDTKKKGKVGAAPVTKKEKRVQDAQLRERYGDTSGKTQNQRISNPVKNKGDYASGERRPFERRSGTGQPAFTNDHKKHGYGKGNVGSLPKDGNDVKKEKAIEEAGEGEANNGGEQTAVEVKEEPREEIITLDEFAAKHSKQFSYLNQSKEVLQVSAPVITEPNLKVMVQRKKDVLETKTKSKNLDSMITTTSNIIATEKVPSSVATRPAHGRPQAAARRIADTEENFPSLN